MKIRTTFMFFAFLSMAAALPLQAQFEVPRVSPNASITQRIGVTDVTLTYSRPGVKGRTIWGGLVPWDQVWRTGANEATTISFSTDVKINGNALPAGKYALFTIPTKDDWTVIFNRIPEEWGAFSYDATKDALRVKVKPQSAAASQELVTFSFPGVSADSADLVLSWEKVVVPLTISVDTNANVYAAAKAAIAKGGAGDWKPMYRAASYSFENNAGWPETSDWLDKSIAVNRNYSNLSLKARMMAKAGQTKQAIALAEEAVKLGQAATPKVDTAATEKLIAEWKAK